MNTFRRAAIAGIATLMVAGACASISSPPTVPPINLPSFPPISIPSGGFGLPSGIIIPGLSIPPGSVPCSLVTGAEVSQILGASVTDTSDEATNCTFITSNFATISVESTTDTDLGGVQFLMGNTGQNITVGGFPGIAGTAIGVPAVYVQKPSGQLQLLGFLGGQNADMINKLEQIAAIGVTRMP